MTNIKNKVLSVLGSNRLQSFYWRTGMMCLAVVIDQSILLIGDIGLSPQVVVVLGLVLGEVSKFIHTKFTK